MQDLTAIACFAPPESAELKGKGDGGVKAGDYVPFMRL